MTCIPGRSILQARVPVLAAAFLCLLLFGARSASAQFGVAAGANFDRLSDISGDREATFENASGFHVGVFYDLPLGSLALRPGLFYMDVGGFDVESDLSSVRNVDMSLIEVPVDLRLRMMTPLIKPYASVGPVLRFASSSDDDFSESLTNFSVAGNLGLGLEIGAPGAQIRLFPEIRYSFGITRMTDDIEFLGATFTAEEELRLNSFMLRLGIAF